jgi:NADH-quinone oxidoreductase subunit G
MPKVTINNEDIEVDDGTTVMQAAAQLGYDIPHFCYHPALSIPANCRMCLVEVEGNPDLQPSCHMPVNDGMEVFTESERVVKARKSVLEFILVNHPVDCPICDQAGECKLQDYYMAYDAQESRLRTEKVDGVKVYPLGPEVVYDGERCILCTRCVRFCEEITETDELTTAQRGDHTEIRTFPGQELDNNYSMCTVDICPVGALTARDFRFKCRVWLMNTTDSICTGCSQGCNIHLDHFRNEVQRYRPRYNPDVNDYWMCDPGRYTYKEVHQDRLEDPMVGDDVVNWHAATQAYKSTMTEALETYEPSNIGMLLSPQASCEGLHQARRFAEEVLETEQLYMGGKPSGESDDLLMNADKNPNRRGIEYVFGGLEGIDSFEGLVDAMESGEIRVLHMMNKHLPTEDDALRGRFLEAAADLDLFVLQSMHRGEMMFPPDHRGDFPAADLDEPTLVELADIALPASSHAEKDGTFVNQEGIAQPFSQSFKPLGNSQPDWQIFGRLGDVLGHSLSYRRLQDLREEMFGDDEEEAKPATLTDKQSKSRAPADAATQPSPAE